MSCDNFICIHLTDDSNEECDRDCELCTSDNDCKCCESHKNGTC